MTLPQLKGKTIESMKSREVGHYNFIEWVMTFTDGTYVVFSATSGANVTIRIGVNEKEVSK
jgi:hypothetical protein